MTYVKNRIRAWTPIRAAKRFLLAKSENIEHMSAIKERNILQRWFPVGDFFIKRFGMFFYERFRKHKRGLSEQKNPANSFYKKISNGEPSLQEDKQGMAQVSRWMLCFCILILPGLNSCSLFYVVKQGFFQLKLLSQAEPIPIALRSKNLDVNQRKKLELILSVREFAENNLKLSVHKNYKDVSMAWDHSIHAISGSASLKFNPYLWWFPITGFVPYKGYFNEHDADVEATRLKSLGFETDKREINGYSTLGFFSDPVWPAMLLMSEHALVELIIHELAHATVYIANQTPFNETFASFIGKRGARAYIEHRYGENSEQAQKFHDNSKILHQYYDFFHTLYAELDRVYNDDLSDEEKTAKKANVLDNARKDYHARMQKESLPIVDFNRVNNAYLLSFKNYHQDYHIFESLLSHMKGDFSKLIDEINYYASRTNDPYAALRDRISQLAGRS